MVDNAVPKPQNILLEKLIERQKKTKQTNSDFARKLNISPSLWNQTRTGAKDINLAVIKGIVRECPEYIPDVIRFLGGNHESSQAKGRPDHQSQIRS